MAIMYHGLGLLEYLAQEVDCMFLSDLHSEKFLAAVREKICTLDWKQFNLKEWNDAVVYITGTNRSFDTAEQAADYLLRYCPQEER